MYTEKLLTRDQFRDAVFARDKQTCVFCKRPAKDAHHIIERRVFDDGGYYLSNGASVCEIHHLECEKTLISVEQVREACGILKFKLPDHFYDETYDKWGNILLPNGSRIKGELFFDESVQKVLKQGDVLKHFLDYVKYQRTFHVTWSPGINKDDRQLKSMSYFHGKRVIVTKKMDGENSNLYCDYFHARSVNGRSHPSRNWVKNFWGGICHSIPKGWRICGENLWSTHSIKYKNLKSYFYGFSIFDEKNTCLSWDDTVLYFELLGITPVEVSYDGIYDEELIKKLYDPEKDWGNSEGWVMRLASEFTYAEFRKAVAKYVRKGHVQTQKHWMQGNWQERNELSE